ncbi:MAG: hypothetical protein K6T57_05600 [Thermaceae bacterium]|nr:hypothetical protein [Thermaceae bacterium]
MVNFSRWRVTALTLLALGFSTCLDSAAADPLPGQRTTYQGSSEDFLNPERGFTESPNC